MTWVLLVYLGFLGTAQIDGYKSRAACEAAGRAAIADKRCEYGEASISGLVCEYTCIKGGTK